MWLLVTGFLYLAASGDAAKILGFFPTPSYSHQIVYLPIMKELALRGHEVVIITTDPMKEDIKNLKQIDVHFAYDLWNIKHNLTNILNEYSGNNIKMLNKITDMWKDIVTYELEHPEVQHIINEENEHFDLFMTEFMMTAFLPFKHRFNCPLIGLTSMDSTYIGHEAVGNPVHSTLYPEFALPFQANEKDFLKRFISFAFLTFTKIYAAVKTLPMEETIKSKFFGDDYPSLMDLTNSIDMLFINVNHVFHTIRPLTPATIIIGPFIHIQPPKALPKDLQLFLDQAKEGVVYFSLGTNMKSKDLSSEKREIILKTFAKLPYKILWKFEADNLPGKPDNVKIQKWVPQQDVLRHKHVKLFITQCGLQSLDESMYNYVPIVGLPFFADQDMNCAKVENKGMGLSLNYKELTVDGFETAIREVIDNPKYKNKVKELSDLLRDEPMSPLERAVWWTEYVLRNKGAQHLKGPAKDIPTYQYYYFDILAFLSLVTIILIYFIYILLKLCMKVFSKKIKRD